jgi:hypothetical protein
VRQFGLLERATAHLCAMHDPTFLPQPETAPAMTFVGAALGPVEGSGGLLQFGAIHVDAFPSSPGAASPCGFHQAMPAHSLGDASERSLVAA